MNPIDWVVANKQSMTAFAPELVLIAGSLLSLLIGAFHKESRKAAMGVGVLSLIGYFSASIYVLGMISKPIGLFGGTIVIDQFAVFFKLFFGITTAVTLIFISRSNELKGYGMPEVVGFMLAITLGMSMMAAATDLLMMFLALETVSVLSYILVGFKKHDRRSSEAGLKYILYGAVSSGVMVFGFSFLYGLSGSTSIHHVGEAFRNVSSILQTAPILLFSLLCVMMGFGYKIATFPNQMWCPDVYEGAPLPVTAFLSVGPKAAGFAMALRFFIVTFDISGGKGIDVFNFIQWGAVIAAISAVTMTLGNLAALTQRNLKRLMAYSSIAHAGYLMMAFATLSSEGVQAILFYLVTYLLMNFGAFFIILIVSNRLGTEEIDGFRGLGWRSPLISAALAIFLFSLTGLPPFAGFVGKFFLFSAVIEHKLYWLAIVGAINTVISLFYYARIIRAMYLDSPLDASPVPVTLVYKTVATVFAVATIIIGVYWEPLMSFASESVASIF